MHPHKLTRFRFGLILFIAWTVACSPTPERAMEATLPVATPTTAVTSTEGTRDEAPPASVASTSTIPEVITGYADFSGIEYADMDFYAWAEAVVRCLNDQGLPATVDPPGDGIDFLAVPEEQQPLIEPLVDACEAGMNFPESTPPSPELIEKSYYYQLALKECLEAEGYTIPDPPTLDYYVENYWSAPYGVFEWVEVADFARMEMKCPQQPPGGFGAWEPGTPIEPLPTG